VREPSRPLAPDEASPGRRRPAKKEGKIWCHREEPANRQDDHGERPFARVEQVMSNIIQKTRDEKLKGMGKRMYNALVKIVAQALNKGLKAPFYDSTLLPVGAQ